MVQLALQLIEYGHRRGRGTQDQAGGVEPMSDRLTETRQQMAEAARKILAGSIDLLTGARRIVNVSRGLPEPELSHSDVLTFVAVDSELDDVPIGSARNLWAPEALTEKDRRRDEYLARAREAVEEACRGIISRYS